MKLSPHFTVSEFEESYEAERLGIENKLPPELYCRAEALAVKILEPLRVDLSVPVIINSGYRCLKLNRLLKSDDTSQHRRAEAADLRVPGYEPMAICNRIIDLGLPFDQLIYEGSWTHVSYRDNPRGEVLTIEFANGTAHTYNGLVAY